jgi:hypothetical protein
MHMQDKRIVLCFKTDDPSEIKMALDYWETNSEGGWQHTVQDIASGNEQPKHRISELVRTSAQAYDLRTRCCKCGVPRDVGSRNDVQSSSKPSPSYTCGTCRIAEVEALRLEQEKQNEQERVRLAEIVGTIVGRVRQHDYSSIDYMSAIFAYALFVHSETAISDGSIGNVSELQICPTDGLMRKLLGRLFDLEILNFGQGTPFNAVDRESTEARLSYYPFKVQWQFVADREGRSFREVFRTISSVIDQRTARSDYYSAITDLWWLLGLHDAISYLQSKLSEYGIRDFSAGEKTEEAIRYALESFSIPQLRYLLWRIAKNVAALSVRRDFTRRHALNTIPGSIIRDCDRALADGWTIKPYVMKWDEEESPLTTLLFDRVLQTGIEGFRSLNGQMISALPFESAGQN